MLEVPWLGLLSDKIRINFRPREGNIGDGERVCEQRMNREGGYKPVSLVSTVSQYFMWHVGNKNVIEVGVVVHDFSPCTWEASGRWIIVSSRPAVAIQ